MVEDLISLYEGRFQDVQHPDLKGIKSMEDLEKEIQRNRDQIAENRMHIAILEEKTTVNKPIKTLTGKD